MFFQAFSFTYRLFFTLLIAAFLAIPTSLLPQTVSAAAKPAYGALLVSSTGGMNFTMAPGERRQIVTTWKNIGTSNWIQEGNGYISIYTQSPKYRKTVFDAGNWMGPTQLRPMEQKSVKPGQTATIIFDLHAPKTPGVYKESFQLAAEDRAWVTGGLFTLNITVKDDAVATAPTPATLEPAPVAAALTGKLQTISANEVRAKAGRPVLLTAAFENTSATTWNSYALTAPSVQIASTQVSFAHPSWKGAEAASVLDAPVPPGKTAVLTFALSAPLTNGRHEAVFSLKANGTEVNGTEFTLPVTVTDGSEQIANAPIINQPIVSTEPAYKAEEPVLRVGVLIVDEETDNKVVITSSEAFTLQNTEGTLISELAPNATVTAYYKDKLYYYDLGQGLQSSTLPLRFIPASSVGVMKIANFDRRLTRNDRHAFNTFRGPLEIRYNDHKDRTWIINEVPMDYYLRGLAETWDPDPMEYQKTMIIAARTYAYFHWLRGGNRAREFMHLISTADDQVYKGYERETQAPRILQAVEETRGVVVTYNGAVAVTPYYARSNGSTKDWSAVWWGNQPHVKGVTVACDKGKTQWGHGVGLAASGALCMAKDGKGYEEILKYFYTGIALEKWWK